MDDCLGALVSFTEKLERNWEKICIHAYGVWANKGWNAPPPCFELYYFFEGSHSLQTVGKTNTQARKGDLFFSDQRIYSRCDDGVFKIYYMTFTTLDGGFYREIQEGLTTIAEFVHPLYLPGLETDFRNLVSECFVPSLHHTFVIKYSFFGIMAKIYQVSMAKRQEKTISPRHERIVVEIIEHIQEFYRLKLELKDFARMFSMNERYLNQIFKSITGDTIISFLIKTRVDKARRLLDTTNMPVTEIALDTGFCDTAHFCKVFKEIEGRTPSEYRLLEDFNERL